MLLFSNFFTRHHTCHRERRKTKRSTILLVFADGQKSILNKAHSSRPGYVLKWVGCGSFA
jgi:hypothetical protein